MELMVLFVFFAGILVCVVQYYNRREKRRLQSLHNMIDQARDGSYDFNHVDESLLSSLENSMNRFLMDSMLANQNLKEHKDHIQTLISDISHQTITPISNILLYTQLLEEREETAQYKGEILAIQEQTEKLSFLINSIVKLSRLENGIITVEPEQNSVKELMHRVMKQCKAKAEAKHILVNLEQSEITAEFDFKWTEEALYNLVDNAIKYTPNGGSIRISAEAYNFYCRIDITDTGMGIEEKEIANIFRRFYRSRKVSDEEGVGIGLYLARQIVTKEGGYIKVSSKPGRGSTFSLFLPIHNCNKTVTL